MSEDEKTAAATQPPNPAISADGSGNPVSATYVAPPVAQSPASPPPSYPVTSGATGASASWWSGDPEIQGATSDPLTSPPRG